jgi:hypothetical protein
MNFDLYILCSIIKFLQWEKKSNLVCYKDRKQKETESEIKVSEKKLIGSSTFSRF